MTTGDEPTLDQGRVAVVERRHAPLIELVNAPVERLVFKRWRAGLLIDLKGEVLEVGVGTGRNPVSP